MACIEDESRNSSPESNDRASTPRPSRPRLAIRKVRASQDTPKRVNDASKVPTPQIDYDDDDDFTNPPKKTAVTQRPIRASRAVTKIIKPSFSSDDDEDAEEAVVGGNYCTIRCSPRSIVNILQRMPVNSRERIIHCGFEDFLNFKIDAIDDRALAMYLMSHVKEDPLRIEVKGKVLPITPQVVHTVLGIPTGGRKLPSPSYKERQEGLAQLRMMCEQNGMRKMFDEEQVDINGVKKKGAEKSKAWEEMKYLVGLLRGLP